MNTLQPAVFLNTGAREVYYNAELARVEQLAGISEALQQLHALGYVLVLLFDRAWPHGLMPHGFMNSNVGSPDSISKLYGVPFRVYSWCPSRPIGRGLTNSINYNRRKSRSGLNKAAREYSLDLAKSWVIGELEQQIEAGNRAGCRTILLNNGDETGWKWEQYRVPNFVVCDLSTAAKVIRSRDQHLIPNVDLHDVRSNDCFI